jgi:opacity protein-like surface antigen
MAGTGGRARAGCRRRASVPEKDARPRAREPQRLHAHGNAVVQVPTASRRIRPYAVGGIGVIHTKITTPDDTVLVEDENFGFNVGGGLTAFLNDRVGVRGDFRYFRAIRNDDATAAADALDVSELRFLRFTVGVTLSF